MPLHGPVAGDHVLDKRNQNGSVMRFSGREGRAVVKDHLAAGFFGNRPFEYVVFFPEVKDAFLNLGNIRLGFDLVVLHVINTPFYLWVAVICFTSKNSIFTALSQYWGSFEPAVRRR
jgi:hypothetical protein